jgi:hypothetical protein
LPVRLQILRGQLITSPLVRSAGQNHQQIAIEPIHQAMFRINAA